MMDSISWEALTFPRDWIAVIFSSSWEMACSHTSGFWEGWVSRMVRTKEGGKVISDSKAFKGGMIV
jgi:hypothetical protein